LATSFIAVLCPVPVKCANWQRVTQFTGSGSQTTAEFSIGGSEWRIVWSYVPNSVGPSFTVFSFFVYPHGEANVYVDSVIKYGSSETSGILYIHQGPKPYYLKILSANTQGYTITVEYDTESDVGMGTIIAIIVAIIAITVGRSVLQRIRRRRALRGQKILTPGSPGHQPTRT
jgi:hypothetical protein